MYVEWGGEGEEENLIVLARARDEAQQTLKTIIVKRPMFQTVDGIVKFVGFSPLFMVLFSLIDNIALFRGMWQKRRGDSTTKWCNEEKKIPYHAPPKVPIKKHCNGIAFKTSPYQLFRRCSSCISSAKQQCIARSSSRSARAKSGCQSTELKNFQAVCPRLSNLQSLLPKVNHPLIAFFPSASMQHELQARAMHGCSVAKISSSKSYKPVPSAICSLSDRSGLHSLVILPNESLLRWGFLPKKEEKKF